MVVQIEFWREVTNSFGRPHRSTLMAVVVPGGLSEAQAVAQAKRQFCSWAHCASWDGAAHGFSVIRRKG